MTDAKLFQLYMTKTSPFARKCRMVAIERGLTDKIEEIDARVRTAENEVLEICPLGRVPTLTGPDGLALTDSTVICEYLDRAAGPPILHGDSWVDKVARAPSWALAEGLLESLAWRTREFRRPPEERSPSFIAYEGARQVRVYDWLEASPPDPVRRDIGHIGLAVALDYGLYRFPEEDWRAGRPRLAAWFESECSKSAFKETQLPPKT